MEGMAARRRVRTRRIDAGCFRDTDSGMIAAVVPLGNSFGILPEKAQRCERVTISNPILGFCPWEPEALEKIVAGYGREWIVGNGHATAIYR